MITNIFKVLLVLLILVVGPIEARMLYKTFASQQHLANIAFAERNEIPKQKFIPQFTRTKDGLEHIAFITMVKDEDDIIYENLVWHFTVGFRRFIIFDNASTDNTAKLIQRFATETRGIATVLIVNDPMVAYNQNKIITAGYRMAHEIWPEVTWFFPVDADEFWVFSQEPTQAINNIPKNIDALSAIEIMYRPSADYPSISRNEFWHKIHYRSNEWRTFNDEKNKYNITTKIFMRYSNNFAVSMGNHHIIYHDIFSMKAEENDSKLYNNVINDVTYGAADLYGIHLREFHIRSPEQAHKKFTNGLKAALAMNPTKKNSLKAGEHWLNYQKYLDNANSPEEAAKEKFKKLSRPLNSPDIIDDPLPIDDAIALYKQLCNLK